MYREPGPEKTPSLYKFLVVSNLLLSAAVVALLFYCFSLEKRLHRLEQRAEKPQAQAATPVATPKSGEKAVIDRLLIEKSKKLLTVYSGGKVYMECKVALGPEPEGKKEFEGDGKTPEGIYKIDLKNPNSKFHKSLRISYPDAAAMENAKKAGKHPGGGIYLHGLPNDTKADIKLHWLTNWTLGCIAVTNAEIDEIYDLTPVGTEIEIKP